MTLPRVGFLGVGWIGRMRLEAVRRGGAVEVAAIADPDPACVAEAAALCPEARAATHPSLLDEVDLDGVVIATPSALHAEASLAFLGRGISVFCQKPLGRNARETAAIVRAARRADRLLATDFCYRHAAGMDEARELVRSGALGQVTLVDGVFHNAYGPDKAWFYDRALSGGGCLMDLGIHLLDLSAWMLGSPQVTRVTSKLSARGARLHGRRDVVEDQALVELDLESGAAVRIACSWNLPAGRDAVIGLSIYGTKGGVALRNRNGSFYDLVVERYRGTSRETLGGPPVDWQARPVQAWAARLAGTPRFDPEAERLVEVAELLDRAYEADGAEVAVVETAGSVSTRAEGSRT